MTYAVTRARVPSTGEVLMTGNNWRRSTAPMAEVIAMALRTQLGSCLVLPTLGIDWARIVKLGTGAATTARATILAGLGQYVRSGQITGLSVDVTVTSGDRLEYAVAYRDPRATTLLRTRITGAI
jgi:hypothetical protein